MKDIIELAAKHEHERKEREELLSKLSRYVDNDELEKMEDWDKESLQERLIIELEEALDRVMNHK